MMGGPLFGRLIDIPSKCVWNGKFCFFPNGLLICSFVFFFSPLPFRWHLTMKCRIVLWQSLVSGIFDWNLFADLGRHLFVLLRRFLLIKMIIYLHEIKCIRLLISIIRTMFAEKTWWIKRQKSQQPKLNDRWTESESWMNGKSKMSIQWTMMIERMQIYMFRALEWTAGKKTFQLKLPTKPISQCNNIAWCVCGRVQQNIPMLWFHSMADWLAACCSMFVFTVQAWGCQKNLLTHCLHFSINFLPSPPLLLLLFCFMFR